MDWILTTLGMGIAVPNILKGKTMQDHTDIVAMGRELHNGDVRRRFFARKIARASVEDEGVFTSDQIAALHDMIDGLTE